MPSLARNRPSSPWPFWLLIAAWVCANTPQPAAFAFLTWFEEARQFSHQQRLAQEVAFLLVGEEAPRVAIHDTAAPAPAKPFPPVPADAVLKKIPLSLERTVELLPPASRADCPARVALTCIDHLRAAPPHEPPRKARLS